MKHLSRRTRVASYRTSSGPWEAEYNPALPPSPPLIAADSGAERFDLAYPALDGDTPTAVLLPFADLLPYLDAALKVPPLHTSAWNDIITY